MSVTVSDSVDLFREYSNLKKVNFDNVTAEGNINDLFTDCRSLTELDLSRFDISRVTTMSDMFDDCRVLRELDLSSFDTSRVTNMYSMFQDANRLTELKLGERFDLDSSTGLKDLENSESWKGMLENNLLDSTDELLEYHNSLSKTNSYLVVNPVEEILILNFDTVGGSQIDSIEKKFGDVWLEPTPPIK
ncbi:BspA family leucine-rich repeat surface protein [Enterococcus faecalis]|nr:BspA family leucine-rich repeat surface protein [Enterococcus faecalis]EGO8956816.1 BspA family leucine-rich repeat surface protein [Enterococcus faecalis]